LLKTSTGVNGNKTTYYYDNVNQLVKTVDAEDTRAQGQGHKGTVLLC